MAQSSDKLEISDPADTTQQQLPTKGKRRNGPSRRTIGLATAGLVLAGVIIALVYYFYAIAHESTDDAFIDGQIISVSSREDGHVAKVYVDDNQRVKAGDLLLELDPRDFQAKLDAARAALHAAEAAQRSRDIAVRLTAISSDAGLTEAKAAVTAAEAMVQNASALVSAAKSQQGEAQAKVAVARAAVEQARAETLAAAANHKQTVLDLKRSRTMARSNTISPQALDHAVTAEQVAAANLNAARSKVATQQSLLHQAQAASKAAGDNVNQALAQVAARQAELEQARARLTSAHSAPVQVAQSHSRAEGSKADVEKARAEVEQAALNLSYTKIHAPTDGYVTQKNVDPGVYVKEGQALMAIVQPDVWVTANFKETQLTHMRPGQPVEISVDTYPDAALHGRVQSIQRGTGSRFSLLPPENATGNFVKVVQRIPVKIVFDRPKELTEHLLVPGMSVVPVVRVKGNVPSNEAKKLAQENAETAAKP